MALSFDVDQETSSLRDGRTSPALLAQGEYGSRAGVPRILKLLERYAIPASFYIPAVSALLHPDDVRRIAEAGHEVGLHGWIHERSSLAEADDASSPIGRWSAQGTRRQATSGVAHGVMGFQRGDAEDHPRHAPALRLLPDGRR